MDGRRIGQYGVAIGVNGSGLVRILLHYVVVVQVFVTDGGFVLRAKRHKEEIPVRHAQHTRRRLVRLLAPVVREVTFVKS